MKKQDVINLIVSRGARFDSEAHSGVLLFRDNDQRFAVVYAHDGQRVRWLTGVRHFDVLLRRAQP
jgi:hypothetical protein